MPQQIDDVLIRQYREDDRSGVSSLYGEIFGPDSLSMLMRRWEWQFSLNPACELVDSRMWVAELKGAVVGFLASFPTRIKLFDTEEIVRFPCDLMVSSEARGRGVGEKLIQSYISSEELLLNALGYSPPAGRMYNRLGYRAIDAEQVRIRPCNLRSIIRDAMIRRTDAEVSDTIAVWVGSAFGSVLNFGLKTAKRLTTKARSSEFSIRRCEEVGTEFDDLWGRLRPAFPITAVRDGLWVRWRFLQDPIFEHGLFCALDQRGVFRGYIDVRVSTRRGLRFGRILDLFCDPSDSGVADALLAEGVSHLEARGVDIVTCLGHHPRLQRYISRYCYLKPKRLQNPALIKWKGDESVEHAVYDAANWHLTHADGDDGFSA